MELPFPVADGAMSVVPIRRVALAPKPIQASGVVGELPPKLDQRQVRIRGFGPFWIVTVIRSHACSIHTLKGYV